MAISLGGFQGEKQIRENAVYITNLMDEVTDDKMGELFGSIGVIKVRVVLIFVLCIVELL